MASPTGLLPGRARSAAISRGDGHGGVRLRGSVTACAHDARTAKECNVGELCQGARFDFCPVVKKRGAGVHRDWIGIKRALLSMRDEGRCHAEVSNFRRRVRGRSKEPEPSSDGPFDLQEGMARHRPMVPTRFPLAWHVIERCRWRCPAMGADPSRNPSHAIARGLRRALRMSWGRSGRDQEPRAEGCGDLGRRRERGRRTSRAPSAEGCLEVKGGAGEYPGTSPDPAVNAAGDLGGRRGRGR